MFQQSHLQGLQQSSSGGSNAHAYRYKVLDEEGQKRAKKESEEAIQRILRKRRESKANKTKNNNTTSPRNKKQACLFRDSDDDSEDEYEYELSIRGRQERQQKPSPRSVTSNDLIETIVELENERDMRIKEIAQLRREKVEAERKARRASQTARDIARRARLSPAVSPSFDVDREYFSDDSEVEEMSERYASSVTLSNKIRREHLSSYGIGERAPSQAVISSARSRKGFTIRERRKQERELELIQKELEEEEELSVRIKPTPLPPTTFLPLYEYLKEKELASSLRRKLERKKKLEDQVKPFVGLERRERKRRADQRDRRSEDSCSQSTKDGTQTWRNYNRDKRAQALLQESKLPFSSSVSHLKELKERRKQKQAEQDAEAKRREARKRNQVPDFEKSKEKWISSLRRARQNFQSTRPDVSHLSMFSEEAIQRRDERQRKKEERRRLEEGQKKFTKPKRMTNSNRYNVDATISMTKTQELRLRQVSARKARMMEKEMKEAQQKEQKKQQLRRLGSEMNKIIEKSEKERRDSYQGYVSLEGAEKKAKQKAHEDRMLFRERQRELKDRVKQAKETGQGRNSLVERYAEDRRKQERRKQALAKVAGVLVKEQGDVDVLTTEEMWTVEDKLERDRLVV